MRSSGLNVKQDLINYLLSLDIHPLGTGGNYTFVAFNIMPSLRMRTWLIFEPNGFSPNNI